MEDGGAPSLPAATLYIASEASPRLHVPRLIYLFVKNVLYLQGHNPMSLTDAQLIMRQRLRYIHSYLIISGVIHDGMDLVCEALSEGRFVTLEVKHVQLEVAAKICSALMSPTNQVERVVIGNAWEYIGPHLLPALSSPYSKLTNVTIACDFTHENIASFMSGVAQGTYAFTTLWFDIGVLESFVPVITSVISNPRNKLCSLGFECGQGPIRDETAAELWAALYSPACRLLHLRSASLSDDLVARWMRRQLKNELFFTLLASLLLCSKSPLEGLPVCMFRELYTY
jgi:hypothetical protein